jgi:hypothetical protein
VSKMTLNAHNGDTVAILNTIVPRTVFTAGCSHSWEYNLQTGLHSCCWCDTRYDATTGSWTAPGRPDSR